MFNFQAFIRKKWSEYSASSGQKGTVVDELAVKPTGLALSDFYNSLSSEHTVNDITNYKNMTNDQLDFFGNKFFMDRLAGDYAFGYVRIWFDQKQTIEITTDTLFTTADNLQYKAIQPGYINKGSFIRSTDNFALYYVDIPIIATAKGDMYNVDSGVINQIVNASFSYKVVTNPEAIVNGIAYESNDQYYKRLLYGINDRSLMTKRSLLSKLPEYFPSVQSMYIAGAGDKYMTRDLVVAVDLSKPIKKNDYLGKTQNSNMVASIAFYQIYPLEAGNTNAGYWYPLSITTSYDYPISIDPIDINADDPGLRGYQLNQECTDDMYKGIFFDDFKTYMEVRTNDLYNIADDNLGYNKIIVPSSDWVYGSHGNQSGGFDQFVNGISAIDVLNFSNNQIALSGGVTTGSVCVGKDIQKRIGIKLTGSFVWPTTSGQNTTEKSNIQFMVAGVNGNTVSGYTGIGFGIKMFKDYVEGDLNNPNAALYFAHAEKYQTIQVFGDTADYENYGITYTGALGETLFRIQPQVQYDFEFVVYDDLKLTLYIQKTSSTVESDPNDQENQKYVTLPSTALSVYGKEINKKTTDHYGTTMKVTLDTPSQSSSDTWTILDLKAFDISEKKSTALFALSLEDLEDPITIYLRANGSSAVGGLLSSGYRAYIWDNQHPSISTSTSELAIGAWVEVPDISNSDGSKDALGPLFKYEINSISRYAIQNRFGYNIFIMLATSGTTKMNSKYSNEQADDIYSVLHVDYIKVESGNINSYHANNKADIYVTTLNNSTNYTANIVTLTKNDTDTYFEMSALNKCQMPVANIISVSITPTQILGTGDYSVVPVDPLYIGSSQEKIRIFLTNNNSNAITVQYISYPSIGNMQTFFDSQNYGKIYGDILIRHKFPITLDFSIQYSGASTTTQLMDSIKQYFDDNNDGVFIVRDFVSYLYNQQIVNNVKEPIVFSYSRYNDDNELEYGQFSDSIETRNIDFYRVGTITVTKL